jgi:hypothetical protein
LTSDPIVKDHIRAAMQTARGAARAQKGAPAHLFRGILLPTVTNAQDFIPNPGFVKSSAIFGGKRIVRTPKRG